MIQVNSRWVATPLVVSTSKTAVAKKQWIVHVLGTPEMQSRPRYAKIKVPAVAYVPYDEWDGNMEVVTSCGKSIGFMPIHRRHFFTDRTERHINDRWQMCGSCTMWGRLEEAVLIEVHPTEMQYAPS